MDIQAKILLIIIALLLIPIIKKGVFEYIGRPTLRRCSRCGSRLWYHDERCLPGGGLEFPGDFCPKCEGNPRMKI